MCVCVCVCDCVCVCVSMCTEYGLNLLQYLYPAGAAQKWKRQECDTVILVVRSNHVVKMLSVISVSVTD